MTLVENEVQLRLVGKPVKRGDAPERLTGQLRYAADLPLPGLLHARVVRSPYASARIVSVDKSAAERTPGVVAVLTAADLPIANMAEAIETGTMIMAVDRVVYAGQPVAVVVGETEAVAELAQVQGRELGLIDPTRVEDTINVVNSVFKLTAPVLVSDVYAPGFVSK